MDRALGNPLGNPLGLARKAQDGGGGIGQLKLFPSDPGSDWIPLSGQRVSVDDYPSLYSAIGDSFYIPEFTRVLAYPTVANDFSAIFYIGGGVVVSFPLSSGTSLYRSSDGGLTWGQRGVAGASPRTWRFGAHNDSTAVILATDNTSTVAAYSNDGGVSWTAVALPSPYYYSGIAYGNGVFLALATGTSGAVSADGVSWSSISKPRIYQSVAFGNDVFLAVSGVNVGRTGDGSAWEEFTRYSLGNTISFGNGYFVTVGTDVSGRTVDGVTWESGNIPAGTWSSVTYGGGVFIATASAGGRTCVSADGKNWILTQQLIAETSTPLPGRGIAYEPVSGNFVAVGLASSNTPVYIASNPADEFQVPLSSGNLYMRAR